MNESIAYIKSFITDLQKEQQDDHDQIARYNSYISQLSKKISERNLILNKLEELLK